MVTLDYKKGTHEWGINIVFQVRELRVRSLYFFV